MVPMPTLWARVVNRVVSKMRVSNDFCMVKILPAKNSARRWDRQSRKWVRGGVGSREGN